MGWPLGLGWLAGVGVWLLCFRSRVVDWLGGFWISKFVVGFMYFYFGFVGGLDWFVVSVVWCGICRLLGLLVFLWYVL